MRDFIVVGGGPVGSHLAQNLSERGFEVLVIEKSPEIGKPLACSGHVSPDIKKFLSKSDFEDILQNSIKGARFHSDLGNKYEFFRDEYVSHVIDRVELDRKKASNAEESGAEYLLGTEVKNIEEKDNRVRIETGDNVFEAKMVAGADGANSIVRQETGFEEPDHFYQGMLCFTDEDDDADFVDVFLEVPEYFGWRIPRGDSVEYGVAVPPGENPQKWLDSITGRYVDESDRRNFCAGTIPIGPPESAISERVLLVGDAAGQTKPFTGGGLNYGMTAAGIAGETVDPEEPESLELYEKRWRSELGNEILLGRQIERVYDHPVIAEIGMKIFSGRIGVHMDRPSSLFSLEQFRNLFR